MLRINNIAKHFDNIKALENIDLTINKGEFFGLLGPNGAGKSTLMNIIVGYLKPDSGQITIDDEMMIYESIGIRKKIGYVPQEIALYLELSAYQNLKIFGKIYDINSTELEKKIDEALELVQLADRKKDVVKDFSGGMKRRLNLAASILHEPEILLCDEPTVGVDPQSRNAIFEMLQTIHKSGKTIVYTTHYMEEAERLCSRLAIIDHGNIIAEGDLNHLVNLLDKKETVKILKSAETLKHMEELSKYGSLIELDYIYEFTPANEYSSLSKLFGKFEEMGLPDSAVEVSRPSLEDVFLNLTGRSLRD